MQITIWCQGLRWFWLIVGVDGLAIDKGSCATWGQAFEEARTCMQRN